MSCTPSETSGTRFRAKARKRSRSPRHQAKPRAWCFKTSYWSPARSFCRYSSKQRNLSFARICSSAEKYMSPK